MLASLLCKPRRDPCRVSGGEGTCGISAQKFLLAHATAGRIRQGRCGLGAAALCARRPACLRACFLGADGGLSPGREPGRPGFPHRAPPCRTPGALRETPHYLIFSSPGGRFWAAALPGENTTVRGSTVTLVLSAQQEPVLSPVVPESPAGRCAVPLPKQHAAH